MSTPAATLPAPPPFRPAPIALAPPQVLTLAFSDGKRLGLQLSGVDGLGPLMKRAGATWLPPRRMWVVEAGPADKAILWLRQALEGQRFDIEDAHLRLRAALERSPERGISSADGSYFTQVLDAQIFPLTAGGFAVSTLYDLPVIQTMRHLRGRFHKYAAAWEVRMRLQDLQDALLEHAGIASEFLFVHQHPVVLEKLVAPPPSAAPITVPAASPPKTSPSCANEDADGAGAGFMSVLTDPSVDEPYDEAELQATCNAAGLRDYQTVGVRHLVRQTSACLGDDMGLGKSRQTVVASRLIAGKGRILILCPASLRRNWQREINTVYPDAVVGIVGEDRLQVLYGCHWVVANYERLGGLVRETALEFAVMAVDEAHYLKEHHAGRTRNAFILAARIPRRIIVTGTPLLSKEIELHTLLRLSGHKLGSLPLADFRKAFAGGKEQRAALAEGLRGWMLRRRKDVLTDLGAKTHQVRYVTPAEGLSAYRAVWNDMTLTVMPKIVKLRQTLEALKTQFVIETVESRSAGDKFIVFCEYMATVSTMTEAFAACGIGYVTLTGADSLASRQKAIDAFQTDPAVTAFIGTTSAAGVGITLTAANYVLFASLPWTPALKRQAEDRAYRLGQKRDVMVITPLVPDTIDDKVWTLLQGKAEMEQEVVEAVRSELEPATA